MNFNFFGKRGGKVEEAVEEETPNVDGPMRTVFEKNKLGQKEAVGFQNIDYSNGQPTGKIFTQEEINGAREQAAE